GKPNFCGRGNPSALPFIDRFSRFIKACARLYLGEDEQSTPASDDINFTQRTSPALRQNAKALCDQESGRTAFGRNSHSKGRLPLWVCDSPEPTRWSVICHCPRPWRGPEHAGRPRVVGAR